MRTPEEVADMWNARHPRARLSARQVSGIEAAALVKLRIALHAKGEDIQGITELFRVATLATRFARIARRERRRCERGE